MIHIRDLQYHICYMSSRIEIGLKSYKSGSNVQIGRKNKAPNDILKFPFFTLFCLTYAQIIYFSYINFKVTILQKGLNHLTMYPNRNKRSKYI